MSAPDRTVRTCDPEKIHQMPKIAPLSIVWVSLISGIARRAKGPHVDQHRSADDHVEEVDPGERVVQQK